MPNQILIADPHTLVRKALGNILKRHISKGNIAQVSTYATLMEEVRRKEYTHLITEVFLEDGSALKPLSNLRVMFPNMHILLFSMRPQLMLNTVIEALTVDTFVSKEAPEAEILSAIEIFINKAPSTKPSNQKIRNPFASMPAREIEVLHYIIRGYGVKQISGALNVAISTVSTIKHRILERTNTKHLKELLDLADLHNIH